MKNCWRPLTGPTKRFTTGSNVAKFPIFQQLFTYGVVLAKGFLRKVCARWRGNSRKVCGNFLEICRSVSGNLQKCFCNDPFPNDPISEWLNFIQIYGIFPLLTSQEKKKKKQGKESQLGKCTAVPEGKNLKPHPGTQKTFKISNYFKFSKLCRSQTGLF